MDDLMKSWTDIQLQRKELRIAAAGVRAFLQKGNVTCEVDIEWNPNSLRGPRIVMYSIDPTIIEPIVLFETNINGFTEDDLQRKITITRPASLDSLLLTFSSTEAYESTLRRLRTILRDESSDSGEEHSSSD